MKTIALTQIQSIIYKAFWITDWALRRNESIL